jgi:hypothetical protein
VRDYPTNLSKYEKYYKIGGSYELPAEIFLDLLEEHQELEQEIERLNEELEIRDILIKGIDKRIDNHFRKIDRCVFEDTNKLIEIQELIKKAMGSDK